jgi:D-glycerate 3-kinase
LSKLWPDNLHDLNHEQLQALHQQLLPDFLHLLAEEKIAAGVDMMRLYQDLYLPFSAWLAAQLKDKPVIVGINGAQGSGKSTLTRILQMLLENAFARKVVSVSIDDLYKTRAQRQAMAATIHPLFITRGVPGTHDIDMGTQLFAALRKTGKDDEIRLPRFNKAADDRYPENEWTRVQLPVDIILFEGWCVGSVAEADESLEVPVNPLEAQEDPDGTWRQYVNQQLAGPYQQFFSLIDILVMLQIPDMQHVYEWRSLQEQKLQSSHAAALGKDSRQIMSDADIARFIMHYERITRATLKEMPSRADIVMKLGEDHLVAQVIARLD